MTDIPSQPAGFWEAIGAALVSLMALLVAMIRGRGVGGQMHRLKTDVQATKTQQAVLETRLASIDQRCERIEREMGRVHDKLDRLAER